MNSYSRWRTVLATLAVTFILVVAASFAFIYSGLFNVAATDQHWPVTHWVLETARTRSIKTHAAGIQVPPGLDDEKKLIMGTEHFAAHCAVCHGAPGVRKGDIAHGLYPAPPDLRHSSIHLSDAELFWVIKNGIKMTGMPAWANHSDEEIWATVAFIKKLPTMSEEEYAKLIMAAMGHGGPQAHPGGAEQGGAAAPAQGTTPGAAEHRH